MLGDFVVEPGEGTLAKGALQELGLGSRASGSLPFGLEATEEAELTLLTLQGASEPTGGAR